MVVRTAELKKLEQLYKTEENQIVLLYGTRVSGTRDLLRQFTRDKELFYTTVPDVSESKQDDRIKSDIAAGFKLSVDSEESFEGLFKRVRANREPKLVFIVDDFQNAIKQDSMF